MSAQVTDEQRAAWRCPRCGSDCSVGYGLWPDSGPVKAQCVPCGAVSDWPKNPRRRTAVEHASDDVEMVAETLHAHTGRSARDFPWGHIDEISRDYYRDSARRLLTRLDEARASRTTGLEGER